MVKHQSQNFGNVYDYIFFYSKTEKAVLVPPYRERDEDYIKKFDKADERGRYQLVSLLQQGGGPTRQFNDRVLTPPPGRHWIWGQERINAALASGLIEFTSGGNPRKKQYFVEAEGERVDDIWNDIPPVNSQASERVAYATQKPEALLERIINASSNPGDLVLDCFCGSGTTAAVAEHLGRRWITADLGRFAIHTTRKRLLSLPDVRPFVVQNLGKYERQAWQAAEFGEDRERAAAAQAQYRRFILDLYGAEEVKGYAWLHGVKAGRMVHVGSVDAPVLDGDIREIAKEFWKAVGKGAGAAMNSVDVLGWDFGFALNEEGKKMAEEANLRMAFKKIPREVLEKKAVEQGDIHFFELAALSTDVRVKAGSVTVELTDFIVPPDDVPEGVQRAITHWSQYVDYWAVDWDYKGDTFHNQWQAYRTRKAARLPLSTTNTYPLPGRYTIMVKVIDILGNDTTKSVDVSV